jgi:CBS domain-containing protein
MTNDFSDFVVAHGATLLDAAEVIEHNHSRCAVVVEDDKVVGVISEGDIMRALLHGVDVRAPLADFVNHSFKFLDSPDRARALKLFQQFGIALIPVLDGEFHLTGVVTLREILKSVTFESSDP